MPKINIAIDGPAGAGKSTIAKMLSRKLGILYLDTGAMYRTVALQALRLGINTADKLRIAEMVKDIHISVKYEENEQHIYLEGEDVTHQIRTPEISLGASHVGAVPEVRIKMVELQREIAANNSVVMDGRDIGTYVLPQADVKIFLTASLEERARRRYEEQAAKGAVNICMQDVMEDIAFRDKNDSTREFAPLKKASDCTEMDTTGMDAEDVADKILQHVQAVLQV